MQPEMLRHYPVESAHRSQLQKYSVKENCVACRFARAVFCEIRLYIDSLSGVIETQGIGKSAGTFTENTAYICAAEACKKDIGIKQNRDTTRHIS